MTRARQLTPPLRRWGGPRPGSGRKPNPGGPGASHLRRATVSPRLPLHVTVRMRRETWNLRSGRCIRALKPAFAAARERFGLRLCHFSVQGNHIHFLVEAADKRALARGMKGLGVRIAKRLNRVMGKRGAVYADRFHARHLRTPTEVARARNYVLTNAEKHLVWRTSRSPAPYTSEAEPALAVAPRSWLLASGW